jgi:hypothetical protein
MQSYRGAVADEPLSATDDVNNPLGLLGEPLYQQYVWRCVHACCVDDVCHVHREELDAHADAVRRAEALVALNEMVRDRVCVSQACVMRVIS